MWVSCFRTTRFPGGPCARTLRSACASAASPLTSPREGRALAAFSDSKAWRPLSPPVPGQRKRVAIAQVLVLQPKLLLMDEPFASLDAIVRMRITQELGWVEREHLTCCSSRTIARGDQHVGCRLRALAGTACHHSRAPRRDDLRPRSVLETRSDPLFAPMFERLERAVMRTPSHSRSFCCSHCGNRPRGSDGWIFYVPAPSTVGNVMVQLFAGGQIWPHLQATLSRHSEALRPGSCWAWVWFCGRAVADAGRTAGAGDDPAQRYPARDSGAAVRDLARDRLASKVALALIRRRADVLAVCTTVSRKWISGWLNESARLKAERVSIRECTCRR